MRNGPARSVGVASRQLVREATRCFWGALFVVSGLAVQAAACGEGLAVDLAGELEARRPRPGDGSPPRWGKRLVAPLWQGAIYAARWWEPKARAWHRLAARIDLTLLTRAA